MSEGTALGPVSQICLSTTFLITDVRAR